MLAEELATAYHRLGNVLGSTGGAFAGNRAAGRANHRKGLAIQRRIAARAPHDLEAQFHLVSSLISTAYSEDEVGPSFALARAAVNVAQSLFADSAYEASIRSNGRMRSMPWARSTATWGRRRKRWRYFERARPRTEEIYQAQPNAGLSGALAQCYKRLGAILVERKEFPKASTYLQNAPELDTVSFNENPKAARTRRDL